MAEKSKYDGNILLNSRTIINCAETLRQFESKSDQKMTQGQLIEFLSLLEVLIIGNTIYYDGSAGGKVLPKLHEAECYIESRTDHENAKSLLKKKEPKSTEETLGFCQTAASTGEFTIRKGLDEQLFVKKQGFDLSEFEDEIKLFRKEWSDVPHSPEKLRERAEDIIVTNKYRGSKCVAGLFLASANHIEDEAPDIPIANMCADIASGMRTNDEISKLLDFLMNDGFRPNLLPSIASELCKASYFSHEAVGTNSRNFHFAYTSHLARMMFEDSELFVQPMTKLAEQLGVKDEPLPHLGLLCFLNTEGTNPFAAFENALEDKRLLSDLFRRVDKTNSMNGSLIEDNYLADQTVKEFTYTSWTELP